MSTTYTAPSASTQPQLLSSSASDTAAGTGARKIRVTYFTSSNEVEISGPFVEDVSMNGTSAVNMTATNVRFVERLDVIEHGTGTTPAGTITIRTSGAATIGTLLSGEPVTNWCHHYVPSGKTCLVDSISFRASSVPYLVFLRKKNAFDSSQAIEFGPQWGIIPGITAFTNQIMPPLPIVGPNYIIGTCIPQSTSTATECMASCSFYQL